MSLTVSSVTAAALTALANGQNRDPFAVLGPHPDADGRGLVIRTFQPAARGVEVRLPDGGLAPDVATSVRQAPSRPSSARTCRTTASA